MKKRVLALAAILTLAVLTTTAQKKSDRFVSGTVSYTKATDTKATYSVSPLIGYYIADKISVGVFGEVGKTATEKNTNVGIFGRCDFMNIGKKCSVFTQASVASNTTTVADVKTVSTSAEVGLGGTYTVTPRLSLVMHVADLVSYTQVSDKSVVTVGFDGINNPLAAAKFGVQYKF